MSGTRSDPIYTRRSRPPGFGAVLWLFVFILIIIGVVGAYPWIGIPAAAVIVGLIVRDLRRRRPPVE